ncbi:PP2C family serine/threonine-protein phosphatase [Anatilimnocola sp. NA78]|uniref:PP2C family serine/threonine-protein phosphatase n=1 Tax=Anatilimnocola sp. NA78 TaxID=3415683 RepID=UPI003CE57642
MAFEFAEVGIALESERRCGAPGESCHADWLGRDCIAMWKAIYDSVQGTSHSSGDSPCQDACRVVIWPDETRDTICIVCADGAGSASHSDIGSALACDTLLQFLRSELDQRGNVAAFTDEVIHDAYRAADARIAAEAEVLEVKKRELACTLLLAIVDANSALFAQIGDGAMVVRGEEAFTAIFWPQSGEYVNTTNFLTSEKFLDCVEIARMDKPPADIAVFTDGLERLVLRFAEKTVHEPFLRPLFERLRATEDLDSLFPLLRSFLDSKAINDRTDDDKTLILASCFPQSPAQ